MRSRAFILGTLVALAAVILVVGVTVAGAEQSSPLPAVSAAELIARMAQADDVTSVSGEISWKNELFGDLGAATAMAGMPAQSPLTSSGSGRLWTGEAGARVESQGAGGDQVVVVNKAARTAWVYDAASGTVKEVVVTGAAPAETPSPAPSPTFMTPEAITLYLQQCARFATVDVTGQARVAGRDAYLLSMTPVADDTALGRVQAAIDGETMLPLSLEVYAKGGTSPVLRFAFDSVSYEPVDPSLFTFTPPEGATVTVKTIDTGKLRAEAQKAHEGEASGAEPTEAQKAAAEEAMNRALLSLDQVKALVPYDLAWARDYTARPFRWGYVLGEGGPLTASGAPLVQVLGAITGMDVGAMAAGQHAPRDGAAKADAAAAGPSSALLYGDGFGAIVLVQTQTTPELEKQLKQLRQTSQILGTATVNGAPATQVATPLGGVIVWQQGETTLLAGGLVTAADLAAFASAVR